LILQQPGGRQANDQRHDKVGPAGIRAGVVEREEATVLQRAQEPGLLSEPAGLLFGEQAAGDHLHGDPAAESDISGRIDVCRTSGP
jgi:hypothetical protein